MAANATKMIKNKVKKLFALTKSLTNESVYVGVPSSEAVRDDDDEVNNAALAAIHDRGAPANNIPARPFMEPGIENAQPKILEQMKKGAEAALDGNDDKRMQCLHRAGLIAQNSVRSYINSGIAPVLSELTLAARRRRGRTGTKALIDTGQLRNSIIYVIRKK